MARYSFKGDLEIKLFLSMCNITCCRCTLRNVYLMWCFIQVIFIDKNFLKQFSTTHTSWAKPVNVKGIDILINTAFYCKCVVSIWFVSFKSDLMHCGNVASYLRSSKEQLSLCYYVSTFCHGSY